MNEQGIVVGVDGSDLCAIAARWAADEAVRRQCGLTLVFALMPPTASYSFGLGMAGAPFELDDIRESVGGQVSELAATLPGADVKTRLIVGSPSGVLLEESSDAAMVVMGSRGMGGFKGLMLGSVSTQVAAHSHCPVVIIRGEPLPESRSIVVGVDGSPASRVALEFAFEIAKGRGARLIALHAWDAPSNDLISLPGGAFEPEVKGIGEDQARRVAEVLGAFEERYPEVEVERRVVRGPAADCLVEAAAGTDLVVVGTRGHGRIMGALVGSVSRSVMHRTGIPMAIVSSPSSGEKPS